MVNTGALFTRNFYTQYFNPQATDRQLLWVGRFSGFGLTLLGVLFALTIKNVLHGFLFTETIAAFMGVIVLGGILWKRANRYGAFFAVIVTFGLYYLLNFLETNQLQIVYKWTPEPFGWAMLAGFTTLIVISLLTKPEDDEKIDHFFDNMSRLSDIEGAEKPLAAQYGKELIFVDLPGWFRADRWKGFFRRYKEDFFGFLLAWVVVGLLISMAWGIMQIGK
jgi:Na+/proline symporter